MTKHRWSSEIVDVQSKYADDSIDTEVISGNLMEPQLLQLHDVIQTLGQR